MLPKWFTPIIIAAIAGLSVWLLSEQAPVKPQRISMNKNVPDSFMEGVATYLMDNAGKPKYEIKAGYIAHYSVDDHTEITSPQMTFHSPDGKQWVLTAESGTSVNGTDQILLHGDVVIDRKQVNTDMTDLQIHTSELLIKPASSYAETDQLITITSGNDSIQSNGIRTYFDEERVELLSNVRSIYAL